MEGEAGKTVFIFEFFRWLVTMRNIALVEEIFDVFFAIETKNIVVQIIIQKISSNIVLLTYVTSQWLSNE